MSLAPKKNWRASLGTLPANTKLTNLVSEAMSLSATGPRDGEMRSFRCCGYIPLGPLAEPEGKLLIVAMMSLESGSRRVSGE